MLNNNQQIKPNWRQHWFVQNVAVELPFFGPFFIEQSCTSAMRDAVKCGVMWFGSYVGMELGKKIEHMYGGQCMALGMVTGMWLGKVSFNCLYSGAPLLYQFSTNRFNQLCPKPDFDQELLRLSSALEPSDSGIEVTAPRSARVVSAP